ncbi:MULTISPECIES: homoserine dehydrogenase [unclassified Hahella]|uniref:homoserine dehydrogenase n=1 Tax=unclassified Hahella TaxID=2624107 RepID=UPI001C1E9EEB|nr:MULTISPECIES: homoserine dehydrogenase [unclassified Hahella]MBU6953743.1 homoserine dehydrogenase [Hahella sp. HN01]MDG9671575.1 homoserine dehydrogenase [Hahella sp. CR1]
MKIAICGLGTVGSGTFNVLARNGVDIAARAGMAIEVIRVASRRMNPACELDSTQFTTDIFAVTSDPEVEVVVELLGGTTIAKELILKAIENGKHVVTANKALIAEHGGEIFELAARKGVTVAFEAAVAGGVPVIKALREGLAANRINWLAGIINGTGNFILTEMRDKGRAFEDVLKEAQALGYAEADPTFDVEGIDAAHKLTILASVAFGIPLQFKRAYTEGISAIAPEDVQYAEEFGYRIKHLGIARRLEHGVELRVHPTLVPETQLIAKVDGVMNAVMVDGDAVGPTLYYGAGAGAEATASAVVADLVDIARASRQGVAVGVPSLGHNPEHLNDLEVVPVEEVVSAYYLRILVQDHPGVLANVAQILSEHSINIESIVQKESEQHDGLIPMIMLTHRVQEMNMNHALAVIEALPDVVGKVTRIRVESFS